ncbi:DUF4158 domain-containing protein [Bacillus sp. FDAARGOS_1420]|uniref:DUF4158 domain-containing protein n=1 Tax=Bacillus sp. FDAARGOS_1420 TaxID=2856338 RepID=UPI00214B6CC3|nr:DUF4158 domain-containing protein [Bacillus sp. FDAARGOS_1420]
MLTVQETAYPRLKSNPTPKELDKLFAPTLKELDWTATHSRNSFSHLNFLIMLKTFQCLNYFVPIAEVPLVIIKHIAKTANITLTGDEKWDSYHRTGTGKRQITMIRNDKKVKIFNNQARQIMTRAMESAVLEKDAKSDIVNVAIDELVKHSYELPAFQTLVKSVNHIHSIAYRSLYKQVTNSLDNEEKEKIDALFQQVDGATYSDWYGIKKDPGRPTLEQIRIWIERKNWMSNRQVGATFFRNLHIPPAKVERLAAEAKTLDAARMKELEPHKRYTLAISLLHVQYAQTIDDIGTMYIKRIAKAENKAEKALHILKEKREKQTDKLITTLRDTITTYQLDNSSETRLRLLETLIGGNRGKQILENCEDYLAYTGNNYFSFMWKYLKSNRSELIKMLESLQFKSTTQNKGLEQAISFVLKNKQKKSEWISTIYTRKNVGNKNEWETVPLVDLTWIPEGWWRWISSNRRRNVYPDKINRRHFEACVFYQVGFLCPSPEKGE